MSDKVEGKRGPWSAEDKKYIDENCGKLTPRQMADALQRDEAAVEKYVREGMFSSYYKTARKAEKEIQSSIIWDDLKQQFTKEELDMFLYHWGRIVSQFKDDVLPTEELQILDTIKLDIMMNRILKTQQLTMRAISDLELKLMNETEMKLVENFNRQLGILRNSMDMRDGEYRELLTKKGAILSAMKATRDARIKDVESTKQNFTTWMRNISENKDIRREIGSYMEKMRIATNIELDRLSQYHRYEDGGVDQPILNSETIIEEE